MVTLYIEERWRRESAGEPGSEMWSTRAVYSSAGGAGESPILQKLAGKEGPLRFKISAPREPWRKMAPETVYTYYVNKVELIRSGGERTGQQSRPTETRGKLKQLNQMQQKKCAMLELKV